MPNWEKSHLKDKIDQPYFRAQANTTSVSVLKYFCFPGCESGILYGMINLCNIESSSEFRKANVEENCFIV